MTYFLDANILSYIIKQIPSVTSNLRELIVSGNIIKIPVVAFYEVKRGLLAVNSKKRMSVFEAQVEAFGLVQMTDSTFTMAAEIYAELRRTGNVIEDDDLFIGCSALENDAVLLTNNARHLSRIPNLMIKVLN